MRSLVASTLFLIVMAGALAYVAIEVDQFNDLMAKSLVQGFRK